MKEYLKIVGGTMFLSTIVIGAVGLIVFSFNWFFDHASETQIAIIIPLLYVFAIGNMAYFIFKFK